MTNQKERPKWVQKAVVADDLAALRFAAEKSHEARARNKDRNDAEGQYYREQQVARADEEASRMAEVEREHIAPLDPDKEIGGVDA